MKKNTFINKKIYFISKQFVIMWKKVGKNAKNISEIL